MESMLSEPCLGLLVLGPPLRVVESELDICPVDAESWVWSRLLRLLVCLLTSDRQRWDCRQGTNIKPFPNGLFVFLHILCQDGKLGAFQDLRGQLLDFQKTKNVGQGILKKLYWKLMTQCKNPVVAVAHVMPISALHNLCSTHRGSEVQNLVCLLCVQLTGGWRGFQVSLGSAWARYED